MTLPLMKCDPQLTTVMALSFRIEIDQNSVRECTVCAETVYDRHEAVDSWGELQLHSLEVAMIACAISRDTAFIRAHRYSQLTSNTQVCYAQHLHNTSSIEGVFENATVDTLLQVCWCFFLLLEILQANDLCISDVDITETFRYIQSENQVPTVILYSFENMQYGLTIETKLSDVKKLASFILDNTPVAHKHVIYPYLKNHNGFFNPDRICKSIAAGWIAANSWFGHKNMPFFFHPAIYIAPPKPGIEFPELTTSFVQDNSNIQVLADYNLSEFNNVKPVQSTENISRLFKVTFESQTYMLREHVAMDFDFKQCIDVLEKRITSDFIEKPRNHFATLSGRCFLLSEYICGCSLSHLSKKCTTEERIGVLAETIIQYFQALSILHIEGVTHGSINTNNIIMRKTNNSPVLVNFFSARLNAGESARDNDVRNTTEALLTFLFATAITEHPKYINFLHKPTAESTTELFMQLSSLFASLKVPISYQNILLYGIGLSNTGYKVERTAIPSAMQMVIQCHALFVDKLTELRQ